MRDDPRQMQEFLNPMGKTLASIIQENTLLTNYKFNIYKGFLDFANSVQQTLITRQHHGDKHQRVRF